MVSVLDCTLRDGGYYTNWDFDDGFVDGYFKNISDLPIEYVEVGYRSPLKSGYHGKYFYLPKYILEKIKGLLGNKKISIMLNLKDINEKLIPELLHDALGIVDLD